VLRPKGVPSSSMINFFLIQQKSAMYGPTLKRRRALACCLRKLTLNWSLRSCIHNLCSADVSSRRNSPAWCIIFGVERLSRMLDSNSAPSCLPQIPKNAEFGGGSCSWVGIYTIIASHQNLPHFPGLKMGEAGGGKFARWRRGSWRCGGGQIDNHFFKLSINPSKSNSGCPCLA
jgi:hypothetical protein